MPEISKLTVPVTSGGKTTDTTMNLRDDRVSGLQTQISGILSLLENALVNRMIISGGNGDDFNTFIETGIHRYQGGPAHCPDSSVSADYGIVLVLRFTNYIVQLAFSYLRDVYVYVRSSADTGENWCSWKMFSFADAAALQMQMAEMRKNDSSITESEMIQNDQRTENLEQIDFIRDDESRNCRNDGELIR